MELLLLSPDTTDLEGQDSGDSAPPWIRVFQDHQTPGGWELVVPHPSFPHLGSSCSPTLAPLPSPETRRQSRVGSCTGPGCPSVLHAGWSTALGRSPLPKPLLRQAAGSELSGLAASKVVFVSAPALAKEQLKPTTSGKKVWHVCWLLLRPLLALLS